MVIRHNVIVLISQDDEDKTVPLSGWNFSCSFTMFFKFNFYYILLTAFLAYISNRTALNPRLFRKLVRFPLFYINPVCLQVPNCVWFRSGKSLFSSGCSSVGFSKDYEAHVSSAII